MLALLLLAFIEPQCPAKAPRPPPAHESKSAAKNREAKAAKLARSAYRRLVARNFQPAIDEANAAMALTPQVTSTLCTLYRTLGYGCAYLNDKDQAKKWLDLFLCVCPQLSPRAAYE